MLLFVMSVRGVTFCELDNLLCVTFAAALLKPSHLVV